VIYSYGAILKGIASPLNPNWNHQLGYGILFEPAAFYAAHADKTYMWLVESYDMNDKGTQFTLHFRKGITWSDGTPFTAKDPATSMMRLKTVKPALRLSSIYTGELDSVNVVDDNTLQVNLNQPDFRFFFKSLTFRFDLGDDTAILPDHIYSTVADKDLPTFTNWDVTKGWPVTTGPYGLADSQDQSTKFDLRPSWWAVKTGLVPKEPDVWELLVTPYTNDTLGVQQVINNEVDFTLDIRPMIMTSLLTQTDHVTTWTGRKPPFGYLDWWPISVYTANNKPPFNGPDSKKLRWAIAHAINHQEVVNVGWVGAGKATSYPFPEFKHLLTYLDSIKDLISANDPQEFSLDKTNALMKELGYAKNKDGFWAKPGQPAENFDLYGPVPLFADLAPIIVQQLVNAGFSSQHKSPNDVWAAIMDGRAPLMMFGHGGSTYDPYDTFNLYRKSGILPVGQQSWGNPARWANADFEKLTDQMLNTSPTDDATMKDIFHKAMTIWYDELPDIPVVQWFHRIPMNNTYWDNWPTQDNPYMNAALWHQTMLQVVINIKAKKA